MDEAEHCDRMALIYQGKMIAIGSSGELKHDFAGNTLLEVIAHPILDALTALEAAPEVQDAALFGANLHVVLGEGISGSERVGEILASKGIAVEKIEAITPSLEDVFVSLIEKADREAGGRTE